MPISPYEPSMPLHSQHAHPEKIKKNYAKRNKPKKKKNRRGIYHLLKGIDTRGRIASCSLACNNDFRRVKTTP